MVEPCKRTLYVHVSFDLVDEFIPRIPRSRAIGIYEDDQTPRICASPSILSSISALPGAGETIRFMQVIGMPIVIHAYYLLSDNVYIPTVQEVPDAGDTGEVWLLDAPLELVRKDFELYDVETQQCKCSNGPYRYLISNAKARPVGFVDNKAELAGRNSSSYAHPESMLHILETNTFRNIALAIWDLLEKEGKEEREKVVAKLRKRN